MNKFQATPRGSSSEIAQFQVAAARQKTTLTQPLYDSALITSLTRDDITFFQMPIGQGGKNENDTNMRSAGQLPSPQSFLLNAISLTFYPAGDESGAALTGAVSNLLIEAIDFLTRHANLVLSISNADYYQIAPLGAMPSHVSLDGFAALDSQVTVNSLGVAQSRGKMAMLNPLAIKANENFFVKMRGFDPAVMAILGIDIKVFVYLWGTWIRAAV